MVTRNSVIQGRAAICCRTRVWEWQRGQGHNPQHHTRGGNGAHIVELKYKKDFGGFFLLNTVYICVFILYIEPFYIKKNCCYYLYFSKVTIWFLSQRSLDYPFCRRRPIPWQLLSRQDHWNSPGRPRIRRVFETWFHMLSNLAQTPRSPLSASKLT